MKVQADMEQGGRLRARVLLNVFWWGGGGGGSTRPWNQQQSTYAGKGVDVVEEVGEPDRHLVGANAKDQGVGEN